MGAYASESVHPDLKKVILSDAQKEAFSKNDAAGSELLFRLDQLPNSAEKQLARRKIQEAVFWMNSCVVKNMAPAEAPPEAIVPTISVEIVASSMSVIGKRESKTFSRTFMSLSNYKSAVFATALEMLGLEVKKISNDFFKTYGSFMSFEISCKGLERDFNVTLDMSNNANVTKQMVVQAFENIEFDIFGSDND